MKTDHTKTITRIALMVAVLTIVTLTSERPARSQTTSPTFDDIAAVLQSPRCMNCHPVGDAPLQTDASRPHKMNIKRVFSELGGTCATCHQETTPPGPNVPPGAPHWSMPPADTPMIFEGKTTAELCVDLQDPELNGHRSLEDLVHHVGHDPLVLWAFEPGAGRTPPPLTHAEFILLMSEWVAAGAPCPN